MSGSSSEDESDAERLREAVAPDFLSDDIYKGTGEKQNLKEKPQQKSLRPNKEEEENQFNGAEVTAEFRKHVAKHLVKMLDNSIKEKPISNHVQRKKCKGGVRLFSNSNCVIRKLKKEEKPLVKLNPTRNNIESDSDEREQKAKSVAVDPELVISKNDTRTWSNRSKAPVFHYKPDKKGKLCLKGSENVKYQI